MNTTESVLFVFTLYFCSLFTSVPTFNRREPQKGKKTYIAQLKRLKQSRDLMLQPSKPPTCIPASMLMPSCKHVDFHFFFPLLLPNLLPASFPFHSLLLLSSPYPSYTLDPQRQTQSTVFIMCLSVSLASPVLLRVPPGVIQSSPFMNPTAKSQQFTPPRTVSSLLSICHSRARQDHMYQSLSTEQRRLKLSVISMIKHEIRTPSRKRSTAHIINLKRSSSFTLLTNACSQEIIHLLECSP